MTTTAIARRHPQPSQPLERAWATAPLPRYPCQHAVFGCAGGMGIARQYQIQHTNQKPIIAMTPAFTTQYYLYRTYYYDYLKPAAVKAVWIALVSSVHNTPTKSRLLP